MVEMPSLYVHYPLPARSQAIEVVLVPLMLRTHAVTVLRLR